MANKGRPPVRQRKLSGGKPKGKTRRKLSAYNRHVQRVMKGGKVTMKQAAASWKGGKSSSTRTAKRSTSRRTTTRRTIKSKVRKVGRKSGFNSQSMMKYIRLAALGAPAIAGVAQHGMTKEAAVAAIGGWTGVDMSTGQFDFARLAAGWTPYLASILVTQGIPKISGIIRGL